MNSFLIVKYQFLKESSQLLLCLCAARRRIDQSAKRRAVFLFPGQRSVSCLWKFSSRTLHEVMFCRRLRSTVFPRMCFCSDRGDVRVFSRRQTGEWIHIQSKSLTYPPCLN